MDNRNTRSETVRVYLNQDLIYHSDDCKADQVIDKNKSLIGWEVMEWNSRKHTWFMGSNFNVVIGEAKLHPGF